LQSRLKVDQPCHVMPTFFECKRRP
jgi:hypothetical protein